MHDRHHGLLVAPLEQRIEVAVVPRALSLELERVRVPGRQQIVGNRARRDIGREAPAEGLDIAEHGFVVRAHPEVAVSTAPRTVAMGMTARHAFSP